MYAVIADNIKLLPPLLCFADLLLLVIPLCLFACYSIVLLVQVQHWLQCHACNAFLLFLFLFYKHSISLFKLLCVSVLILSLCRCNTWIPSLRTDRGLSYLILTSKPVMAIWCMESLTDLMMSSMVAKASSSSTVPSPLLHFNISWKTGGRNGVRKTEVNPLGRLKSCPP